MFCTALRGFAAQAHIVELIVRMLVAHLTDASAKEAKQRLNKLVWQGIDFSWKHNLSSID